MACAVHRRLLEEYGAGPDHRFLLKIPHSLFNSEDVDASNAPTSNVVNETTDRFYNIFSDRFWLGRIDLRPLGLMRVVFGAVLFWSTIDLAPVLRAFFSDDGVVPRAALLAIARNNRVSVFDFSGPPWLLVGMYALTLAAIMAFTVGFRSRLASVATFVLVTGLHERNTYALDGSDNVLRVMLFWMMFMPVGARYSFDALARDARGEPTMTHGMAMPIRLGQLQIAWVYLNTVLYKWPGVAWHDGTALRIALGLDHMFVRRPGQLLFHQRPLVALGTHATIYVELLFLPLVFPPARETPARVAIQVARVAVPADVEGARDRELHGDAPGHRRVDARRQLLVHHDLDVFPPVRTGVDGTARSIRRATTGLASLRCRGVGAAGSGRGGAARHARARGRVGMGVAPSGARDLRLPGGCAAFPDAPGHVVLPSRGD